ncbi:MAG: 50S ribosomal protein L24, partial [Chlamydiota bacterium]
VEGVNIRKKHVKKTQKMQTAQIIDREMPIHISNVSFCNGEGKPISVSVRMLENGNKELIYSENGKDVLLRSINKR